VFNTLNSASDQHDFSGFWFVMDPTHDPVARAALECYAARTPNLAQRQAILKWLQAHPKPQEPVVEQMEMGL